jgi:hypothetical protein
MLAFRSSSPLIPACVVIAGCLIAGPPLAAQTALGIVDRVQGDARIVHQEHSVAAKSGHPVAGGDVLRTGAGSRLRVVFHDGTRLTLGESAEAFIADFVYNPIKKSGAALLDIIKGAFRFTSGELGRLTDKRIAVRTSRATASVSSAQPVDIWGGPIDDTYGLLLLTGDGIEVRNNGGMVVLDKKRLGSTIPGKGMAPDAPVAWDKDKVGKAIAAIAFK